jgi:uncharacterized protein
VAGCGMTDASPDATTTASADPEVVDNPVEHRFEIRAGGQLAGFLQYRAAPEPGLVTLVHTEIDSAFEGRGLGSKLIGTTLDTLRGRGAQVLPRCEFVSGFIKRHPQYLDLVPPARRREFDLPAETGSAGPV